MELSLFLGVLQTFISVRFSYVCFCPCETASLGTDLYLICYVVPILNVLIQLNSVPNLKDYRDVSTFSVLFYCWVA
jgi:hypothetical protein